MDSPYIHARCRVVAVLAALLALGTAVHAAGPGFNGRVIRLNEKGVPQGNVAGAKIEFKNRSGKVAASATSDKKGYYKVNLAPGTYTYKVQAAGYKDEDAGRGLTLTQSSGYTVHNFSLIRGKTDPNRKAAKLATGAVGTLKGQVQAKAADGKMIDIPQATIAFRKAGDMKATAKDLTKAKDVGTAKAPTKVVTRSDDPKQHGHYEVVLEAGSYQVSVSAAGYETLVIPDPLAITAGKTDTRDFVLALPKHPDPSGQGIKGSVKFADSKGAPPKVKLSIHSLSETGTPSTPLTPDAQGAYQRDLRAGRYEVVAEADGFRTASSGPKDVFTGKYTVVDLRLASAANELVFVATVYERLSGDGGRKPLPGASVMLRKPSDNIKNAVRGTTGADGKVSLKAGAPGTYQALATMKGYKPAGLKMEIGAGANKADIELVKDAALVALHLRVVDGKDRLPPPVGQAKLVVSQQGRTIQSATTDAKGLHTFSLPPGTYQIDVTHTGYTPAKMDVTLASADVSRDIVLAKTLAKGMLNLHVIERLKTGDKAIPGADIVISHKDPKDQKDKRVLAEKSGQDGKLAVPLPPGNYTVAVTKAGFKPNTVQVNVAAQDVNQDIVLVGAGLPTKKLTLHLRVVDRQTAGDKTIDKAIAGADIVISHKDPSDQKDKRILADKSGQDGKLAAPLPPGSYTVTVTHARFKQATIPVNLTTQDVNQDVVLIGSAAPTKKLTLHLHVVERVKSLDKASAGADIVISQKDKRILADKSGKDGKLAAPLPAGTYTVVVTKAGFKQATVQVNLTTQDVNQDVVLIASVPGKK